MEIFKYISLGSVTFLLVVVVALISVGLFRLIMYLIHASESELFETAALRSLRDDLEKLQTDFATHDHWEAE